MAGETATMTRAEAAAELRSYLEKAGEFKKNAPSTSSWWPHCAAIELAIAELERSNDRDAWRAL